MTQGRAEAVQRAGERLRAPVPFAGIDVEEEFQAHVFNRAVMKKMLSKTVYKEVISSIEEGKTLNPECAASVAASMKEWAIGLGATHFTHWFQPLTGATAEKHDAFIEWHEDGGVIEQFTGAQLVQGEPDASSFPSGGLRSTWEARGYTGWDPSSPPFLWKGGDGITLCIPSIFFSWTGAVLDHKIPLHRSERVLNEAVLRLLKKTATPAQRVFSTLGWEQEYFIIDRAIRNQRPDLVMLGKTVVGASPAKGQELQDHYFGAVKDRVLSFMQDFEQEALKLGIPVKTRHNEVAPAQHEVAPVFEATPVSCDHNILLMELMRQMAVKHNLACLLHEKPFAELNGSGKHNNWSMATDTGHNLLDPTDNPGGSLQFLMLLAAILEGVHDNADLLMASIGSAGNDHRLGGHEAPPAIISVFLGESLERVLQGIEDTGQPGSGTPKGKVELGIPIIPDLTRDDTDRNRTSPFAFTGNKFEFRAVGSEANCAFPMMVLNVIVAKSLNRLIDAVENSDKPFEEVALSIIQESLKRSHNIRFVGDNYSTSWEEEAKKRGLPMGRSCVHFYEALRKKRVVEAFEGILTQEELESRYEILMERYAMAETIEAKLIVDLYRTKLFPACIEWQDRLATSIHHTAKALGKEHPQEEHRGKLAEVVGLIEEATAAVDRLATLCEELEGMPPAEWALRIADEMVPLRQKARAGIDQLEQIVDDSLWPLPKYREMLFLV